MTAQLDLSDDLLVAELVAAGVHAPTARLNLTKWRRWGLDPFHETRRFVDGLRSDPVATCPCCGTGWQHATSRSWWLTHVVCWSCARDALGIEGRCPTALELRPFEIGVAPAFLFEEAAA
jgi:hypothetical protein